MYERGVNPVRGSIYGASQDNSTERLVPKEPSSPTRSILRKTPKERRKFWSNCSTWKIVACFLCIYIFYEQFQAFMVEISAMDLTTFYTTLSSPAESITDSSTFSLRKDRPNAHATCGVVWFYHIPKTGGTTMVSWLSRHEFPTNESRSNMRLLDFYHAGDIPDDPEWWIPKYYVILDKVRDLENAKPNQWFIVNHHNFAPGMKHFMPRLRDLRTQVEGYGCQFLLFTMFREPISHFFSFSFYNGVPEEYFEETLDMHSWDYRQSKYLLYNWLDFRVTFPQIKVSAFNTTELFDILSEFDIIGFTDGLNIAMDILEENTHWKKIKRLDRNRTPMQNKYPIPPDSVSKIVRLLENEIWIYHHIRATVWQDHVDILQAPEHVKEYKIYNEHHWKWQKMLDDAIDKDENEDEKQSSLEVGPIDKKSKTEDTIQTSSTPIDHQKNGDMTKEDPKKVTEKTSKYGEISSLSQLDDTYRHKTHPSLN